MDATLEELTLLVKDVKLEARKKGTFFDFAIIYPDARAPVCRKMDIGSTCAGKKGVDDNVSLCSKKFQIGNYLDVAITPPSYGGGPLGRDRDRDRGRRNRPY